jgi:hypothetical protein
MVIVVTKCPSILWFMVIVVTWHISETFATSSFRLPVRGGGSTRHNVITTLEHNGMCVDSNNHDNENDDDGNDKHINGVNNR